MRNPDYDEEPEHILKKVGLKFRLPSKRETTEKPLHDRETRELEERMRRRIENGW